MLQYASYILRSGARYLKCLRLRAERAIRVGFVGGGVPCRVWWWTPEAWRVPLFSAGSRASLKINILVHKYDTKYDVTKNMVELNLVRFVMGAGATTFLQSRGQTTRSTAAINDVP